MEKGKTQLLVTPESLFDFSVIEDPQFSIDNIGIAGSDDT